MAIAIAKLTNTLFIAETDNAEALRTPMKIMILKAEYPVP